MILEISDKEQAALLDAINRCCTPEKQVLTRVLNLLKDG